MNTTRSRAIALGVGVALVLPITGAAVMSWGVMDRADRIDDIPVAIVNDDEIITGDRPMAAGRALTDALVHPAEGTTGLGWTVTDDEDAAAGLESGEYLAVLTIPSDFSAGVLSVSGDDPVATELELKTDPAASATAAVASRVVSEAAAETLGREVTTAFLTTSMTSVGELSEGLKSAAEGAGQVADGATRVRNGSAQVDAGSTQLAEGLDQLNAGAAEVAAGNGRLVSGATSVADGSARLAAGAEEVAAGTAQLGEATSATAAGSQQLSAALADLASTCPAVSASPQYCAALTGAAQSAGTLAASSGQVAAGAAATAVGATTLSDSFGPLVDGAASLKAGAESAAAGADQLAGATSDAAAGAHDLVAGSTELSSGADALASATQDLASGLAEGAGSAPSYTGDEIDQLAAVVTQPVTMSTTAISSGSGWLPAAVTALVLWLGAIATAHLRFRAISAAAMQSPASDGRLTLTALRGAMAFAVTQGVAVTLVIAAFGLNPASLALFGAVAIVASTSFTAIGLGLRMRFRRLGLAVFAAFTALQAAALPGVLPVQTAPPWLAALEPFLPVPAFLDAASRLADASSGAPSVASVACLVAWAVLGAGLVFAGVRRRRAADADPSAGIPAVGGLRDRMAS